MLAAPVTGSTPVPSGTALSWSGAVHPDCCPFPASQSRCGNNRLESRMRENRTYGSEGGEARAFPTPIHSPSTQPHSSSNDAIVL